MGRVRVERLVAAGTTWRKVTAPKKWHPAEGEVIQGIYQGLQHKDGRYGPYQVALIKLEDESVKTLSGVVLLGLIAGACIEAGALIRVVFLGARTAAAGQHSYNDFDLYVADKAPEGGGPPPPTMPVPRRSS